MLERQLVGEGHLSLSRMFLLPTEFFRWYAVLLLKDYGWPQAFAPVIRMAKMELPALPVVERKEA